MSTWLVIHRIKLLCVGLVELVDPVCHTVAIPGWHLSDRGILWMRQGVLRRKGLQEKWHYVVSIPCCVALPRMLLYNLIPKKTGTAPVTIHTGIILRSFRVKRYNQDSKRTNCKLENLESSGVAIYKALLHFPPQVSLTLPQSCTLISPKSSFWS